MDRAFLGGGATLLRGVLANIAGGTSDVVEELSDSPTICRVESESELLFLDRNGLLVDELPE